MESITSIALPTLPMDLKITFLDCMDVKCIKQPHSLLASQSSLENPSGRPLHASRGDLRTRILFSGVFRIATYHVELAKLNEG